jgi:serine/threonine protein kinase
MASGKPLFKGENEKDQLDKIFRITGTPETETEQEKYEPVDLSELVPALNDSGIDLLNAFLQCDPSSRISATDALKHPFLEEE